MGRFVDLTGKQFGKLKVIERHNNKNKLTYWRCKCECGKEKIVRGQHLRDGLIVSCGCHARLVSSQAKIKRNKIEVCEDYAKVYLSNSEKYCLIDTEDIEKVKNYCWALSHFGYVTTHLSMNKRMFMHRLICGVENNAYGSVDHINHNTLDNRKSNLRYFESNTQNLHNLDPKKTKSKTGVMNIYFTRNNKYQVVYKRFNKKYTVGTFENLETAKQELYKSLEKNNFMFGGF